MVDFSVSRYHQVFSLLSISISIYFKFDLKCLNKLSRYIYNRHIYFEIFFDLKRKKVYNLESRGYI